VPGATELDMTPFFGALTIYGVIMFFAVGPLWRAFMGHIEPPFGLSQESMVIVMRVVFGVLSVHFLIMTLTSLLAG